MIDSEALNEVLVISSALAMVSARSLYIFVGSPADIAPCSS
jgi:hypothetical protein